MADAKTSPAPTLTDLLFEDATRGRCLVAPDGTVLRANSEWLRSTGFSEEQVLGENIIDLFPATRDMAVAMHAHARAGRRVEVPRHAQTVNGRETWWEGSIEPVPMEGGTGLLISAHDVTGRAAQAQADSAIRAAVPDAAAAEVLRTLMACVPEGITIATAPDVTTWMSSAYGNELLLDGFDSAKGLSMEGWLERVEHYLPDGVTPARVEDLPLWRAVKNGELIRDAEFVLKNPKGERLAVLCNAAPLRDARGAVTGGIVAWRDITGRKRAEEALRASEEKFRQLVNQMADGLQVCELVLDEESRPIDVVILDVNPAYEKHTGLTRAQVVGRRVREILSSVEQVWLDRYGELVRTGRPIQFEEFNAGLGRWFRVSASPMGRNRFAAIFADVTVQKQLEQAVQERDGRIKRTLDTLLEGCAILDFDWTYLYVNESNARHAHLSVEAMLGRNMLELLPGVENSAFYAAYRRCMEQRVPQQVEAEYTFPDGAAAWYEARVEPVPEGIFVLSLDVTERKKAEKVLRETNERLREADRRKNEFLGMLSHELRNPLAPIRNSTYILQHAAPDSEQARRAQTVIQRQTEHLTRLVDDLLDVTRIVRGKIELRRSRVDLRDVVGRAADDYRWIMRDHGVKFEVVLPSVHLWVDADATRITQIVGNLLHNAAKFTTKGDEVILALDVDANEAAIRVRDTGRGIETELLPRVFEPFVQGERTLARTDGGLGLGLALVKGIAELHGGSVEARSDGEGRGAEFVVRLPLAEAVGAKARDDGRARRSNGGRRVLVVDDNTDAAESLADLVRMLGHAAEVAYDGPAALESARLEPPDVVLCDVGLPGMSGYEVARALRASALEGVQLIAVSGYAQPEDVKRAMDAGFDGHVAKPCDPEEIARLLG